MSEIHLDSTAAKHSKNWRLRRKNVSLRRIMIIFLVSNDFLWQGEAYKHGKMNINFIEDDPDLP